MKKIWIGIVNILIMLSIVLFVIIYTNVERNNVYNNQIKMFESTAIRMNYMTENYLKSEQDVCDNWANYINSDSLSMDEALSFISVSKKNPYATAHIVYKNTLSGKSSAASIRDSNNYNVSYSEIGLFNKLDWISDSSDSINVSRAYTNPIDAIQSMAFCRTIKLVEGDAYLLRVIPVSIITDKLTLTQEGIENIELSLIDSEGNYIIRDTAYKNSNFFEFYKSYNKVNEKKLDDLKKNIANNTGTFEMDNSFGIRCVIAHTPVATVGGWVLLSYIEASNLSVSNNNWMFVGVISFGLIMLLIIDMLYAHYFYVKLKYLSRQAEIANKAKTDFLSTMSHDIRTPMNAIVGLTVLTEKNIDDKALVKEYNRKIALASNHLLTLINDILDISKVESGRISLNPISVSLVEMIENLVNVSYPLAKDKNISFSFNIKNIIYENLYADKLRLNQIFINILSNAIKYTETGGVSVDLIEEESENKDFVKLIYIVSDTGIGMSNEFMQRMYDPFIRETDSRINRIEGTGLGLAITKKMVDLMGGTIECESVLESGTTFKITLEIKKEDSNDIKLEGITILAIDSDDKALASVSEIIDTLGANVITSKPDNNLFNIVNENKIDVILFDLDGIDILDDLKKKVENIPIIITSIHDPSNIKYDYFISKPIFRSTLYNKINEILYIDDKISNQNDEYLDIKGMTILIAEDNDINYEIVSEMLKMYEINTIRAVDGLECLDIIKKSKDRQYDLIFMDIQMPRMNGLEATKNIRMLDNWAKDIPIIAMTADAFSENINECLNAGMNGHIAKPIDLNVVLKEIRRIKEERK